jgi:hypothetical protein
MNKSWQPRAHFPWPTSQDSNIRGFAIEQNSCNATGNAEKWIKRLQAI